MLPGHEPERPHPESLGEPALQRARSPIDNEGRAEQGSALPSVGVSDGPCSGSCRSGRPSRTRRRSGCSGRSGWRRAWGWRSSPAGGTRSCCDVVFAEDASTVHTGSAPRAMAALRNLAIGRLRRWERTTSPRPPERSGTHPNTPSGSGASPTARFYRELEAALTGVRAVAWCSPLPASRPRKAPISLMSITCTLRSYPSRPHLRHQLPASTLRRASQVPEEPVVMPLVSGLPAPGTGDTTPRS